MTTILHRQRAVHGQPTMTAHGGISALGRLGLAARGVLYLLFGYLALRIAFGVSTNTANRKGALQIIAHQPYGNVLLGVMAVGFGAYALWQLTVARAGGSSRRHSEGAGRRVTALATGVLYGFFCVTTAALAIGSSQSAGSTSNAAGWTGRIMTHSHGRLAVGVVGAVVVIVGLVMAGRALSGRRDVPLKSMTRSTRRVVEGLAGVGLTARAVIVAAVGVFIVRAAQTFNPAKVKGLDGVLQSFAHTPVGPWLLVGLAMGVVAFGLYSLAAAKYAEL
ncbi:MAG: DUF1206 domain-containing protein [Acidimicrobiales bacterium]